MLLTNVTNNYNYQSIYFIPFKQHDRIIMTQAHIHLPARSNNLEVDICQNTQTLLFLQKLGLQHCSIHWICFSQMSPTINYLSIDICSFNHAIDWPRFDASSTHLIQCCAILQHTAVVSFIIGLSCLVRGLSCHLGQAV